MVEEWLALFGCKDISVLGFVLFQWIMQRKRRDIIEWENQQFSETRS